MKLQLPVLMLEFLVPHHYICFLPFAKPAIMQYINVNIGQYSMAVKSKDFSSNFHRGYAMAKYDKVKYNYRILLPE
jgi:hypothetical protein